MTYAVTPGTIKATQAKQFGDEMVKACRERGISFNELARSVGHGHTAIDHYRKGSSLPRTETAIAIAEALNWPKLKTMILSFRSYPCARAGCGRVFVNEGGGPKLYCSTACLKIAENLRIAERRRRQAGQLDTARHRNAADRRMKGVITTLQGELAVLHDRIEAMCRSCEPEGLCRNIDCDLRTVSPLPFHKPITEPTTDHELRAARWTPERHRAHSESLRKRWSRSGERQAQSERTATWHATRTPEQRAGVEAHSTRNTTAG